MPTSDTSIVNVLLDSVNTWLVEKLQTDIPTTDGTKAGLVRPGLLQDNPLTYGISVLSYNNDPDDETGWGHSITQHDLTSLHNPQPYELGGGEMWFRRFTTKAEMYWPTTYERQQARQSANVVLSRIEYYLRTYPMIDISDSFGEYAAQLFVIKDLISDGGGVGQFIHHGKIWWQVLTSKSV